MKGVFERATRPAFTKRMEGMDVEGEKTRSSQYIEDEEGRLLREEGLIRARWVKGKPKKAA